MSKSGQHVIVSGNKWAVVKSGSMKATKTFATRAAAVTRAKQLAKTQKSAVYVHDKSGLIRERIVPA